MPNQSGEGPRFPTTCARCGGLVSEPVSFCPHCGTHARLAFRGEAPREAPARKIGPELPLADALGAPPPTPLFASADFNPYVDSRPPTAGSSRRWGIKGGTALILASFVVLYGGVVLLHRHDDASTQTQQRTLRTAEGTVQGGKSDTARPGDADARRSEASTDVGTAAPPSSTEAKSSGVPKIAAEAVPPAPAATVPPAAAPAALEPAAPSATTQSAAPATAQPAAPQTAMAGPPAEPAPAAPFAKPAAPAPSIASIAPAARDRSDSSATSSAEHPPKQSSRSRSAVASVVVPPSGRSEKQPAVSASRSSRQTLARALSAATPSTQDETRDERRHASASRSLAVAQESLAKSNLSAARRAITAAQAAQPDNSEAFMLQKDLYSREKSRDAAISAARMCAAQRQWNCAWHNAGSALSIDSGSVEAKALYNRAYVESGAAARPAGPGPDGPDVPLLTTQ